MVRDLAFLIVQMTLVFVIVACVYAITYAFFMVTP